jgi:hypothetical protein
MPDSSYVFESGTPVKVGSHGQTSYLFHSGDAVLNEGESTYVFESGVGLRGGLVDWYSRVGLEGSATDSSVTLYGDTTVTPEMKLEHDGSNTAGGGDDDAFLNVYNQEPTSGDFTFRFLNSDYTDADPDDNNYVLGATTAAKDSLRLFDSYGGPVIYFISAINDRYEFIYRDSSTDNRASVSSPWSSTTDVEIEKSGSTATLYFDGSSVASVSGVQDADYHAAATLEDDGSITQAETGTVGDFQIV